MIDLSDQIEKLKTEYHIINTEFMFDVSTFSLATSGLERSLKLRKTAGS